MSDFERHLEEQLKDPEFASEWEAQKPERDYIKAILEVRKDQNLTQKELAEKSGVKQSNISRIETGSASPTVATLQKIAKGVGKTLHLEFR